MLRELLSGHNLNFYEGISHRASDKYRSEIFTKSDINVRKVTVNNSEILNYLFLSDFKHIYCSTTTIMGHECISIILDENLITEKIIYTDSIFGKVSKIFGLELDNYPMIPNVSKQRLICTIRIDKQIVQKTNQDIYIYSYKQKQIFNIEHQGSFNFYDSLNIIQYIDKSHVCHEFILFPESYYHGKIRTIGIGKPKLKCSRLEDFNNELISEFTYPMNNLKSSNDNPFENYKKYEAQDKSDILNTLYFLLSKKEFLPQIFFNINIKDDEIICHIFINSNLNITELEGFPVITHNKLTFMSKKTETKKILFSLRQSKYYNSQLLYFSYFGYVSKLIDDNHNLSNASDSFSLAFHNGKYISSDMWSGKSYNDYDWFIIFYDDDSKNLYQLPVGEVEKIPKYNNVSIEKRGSFYYAFKGHSVKTHRRLVDLLEKFYFEYDFRHKEIFKHSVIRYYDDKK